MWSPRVTCLFVLACICGVTLGWELNGLSSFTVPVFMWSDKQIFSKSQVLDTVNTRDIEYALAALLHKSTNKVSKLSASFDENAAATELVILFVEPELRTDQVPYIASAYASAPGGSFTYLKNALEAATSSLSMPYATVDKVSLFDSFIGDTVDHVTGQIFMSSVSGSTLFSGLKQHDDVKTVAIESLMSTLSAGNVFDNGVTDFVIVCLDQVGDQSFNDHDNLIGQLTASIGAKGNYVAVYAANMPRKTEFVWSFESHSRAEFQHNVDLYMFDYLVDNDTNSTNNTVVTSTKINYFPGPFLEALLICAILITMLFTGACAIFSLQTPDKWEVPKTTSKRDL